MKKIFKLASLLSIGAMLFASSCSRDSVDETEPIAGEKQRVTINVSTFGTSVSPMGIEKQSVKPASDAGIRQYTYRVYQWSGTSFNSNAIATGTVTAPAGEDIANQLTLSLYRGRYQLTMVAMGVSTGAPEGSVMSYYNTNLGGTLFNSDRFFNFVEFEVEDTSVSSSITLNRMVGRMDVVLTARLPENVASFRVEVNNPPFSFVYKPALSVTPISSSYTVSLTQIDALKSADNGTVSFYLFGGAPATMSVTLKAYDAGNTLLVSRVISNVGIYNSQVTTLRGKMFPESAGWDILVNDTPWETRTPTDF